MIDYTALRTELETDPGGFGYGPHVAAGSTGILAAILNQERPAIRLDRGVIEGWQIVNAIVPAEWRAITDAQRRAIEFIVSAGSVDVSDGNVKDTFLDAFAGGTATRAALVGLATRDGSRAEELFGVAVSHLDVARALREG